MGLQFKGTAPPVHFCCKWMQISWFIPLLTTGVICKVYWGVMNIIYNWGNPVLYVLCILKLGTAAIYFCPGKQSVVD